MAGFNNFGLIADRLEKALAQTVKAVATDMEKDAKSLAPVDTGFLRDSIYSSGSWGSTYGEATAHTMVSKKKQSSFKRQAYLERDVLPEVTSSDDLTAYVAVGATYGIYLEYGTRFMPPQPYFSPAIRIAEVNMEGRLAVIEAQLGVGGLAGSVGVEP